MSKKSQTCWDTNRFLHCVGVKYTKMQNRKSQMTKRMLQSTMIEMLQTVSLERISISRLCDAANLNRSTFYAYYPSPRALFDEIEDEFITHIPVLYQKMSDAELLASIGKYTAYLQANADTFRAIVKNGNLPEKFSSLWTEQRIMSHGADAISVNRDRTRLIYTCSAAGITALFMEWVSSPSDVTPEELAWIVLRIFRTGKDLA